MAGSIAHTVNEDGSLMTPEEINDSLENGGDVYEAIEEYYYENRHYKTENAALRKQVNALITVGDVIEMFAEGENVTRVNGEGLEYWQGEWRKVKGRGGE